MLVYTSEAEMRSFLLEKAPASIGFVPTMGALHEGHLTLIDRAVKENELVVVSIFVNPSQFNNSSDLEKYPRDLEKDVKLLANRKCDVVYAPSVQDVYPDGYTVTDLDLGELDRVMEGEFRPGHFKGVAMVVKRLFEIVKPTRAYFGLKDFQQVAVVRKLNEKFNLVPEIIGCETVREPSGLAMSSRNELLTPEQRTEAAILFKVLSDSKVRASQGIDPAEIRRSALSTISERSSLKPEYFEIVDEQTLEPLNSFNDNKNAVACVAAWAGSVRLIDNLRIFP